MSQCSQTCQGLQLVGLVEVSKWVTRRILVKHEGAMLTPLYDSGNLLGPNFFLRGMLNIKFRASSEK